MRRVSSPRVSKASFGKAIFLQRMDTLPKQLYSRVGC